MRQLSYLWVVLFAFGCASQSLPQDQYEGLGFIQEKLDTSLTAIETAYRSGGISQEQKNNLLDSWFEVKRGESAALRVLSEGGAVDLTNLTGTLRLLIRELVFLGVLEVEE